MNFVKKMAVSSLKFLEKDGLDDIVDHLVKDYDNFVSSFENDGTPPTEEQATELEQTEFDSLNQKYDEQSKKKCGRDPMDEKDIIAVRKRILNRELVARKGRLFAKFSGVVTALVHLAESSLRYAVESLAELELEIRHNFPQSPEYVEEQIALMVETVTEHVASSFPDGIEGLDNYDDGLPDGVPSWQEFLASVEVAKASLLTESLESIAVGKLEIADVLAADMKQQVDDAVRETMNNFRARLKSTSVAFLNEEQNAEFVESLMASVNDYEGSRL